ncbi:MAG: adenosylcobinamide amidohydrolase, partial [Vicinamibacterales bacterium]
MRRHGRFFVADLHGPHLVLSTSSTNGGQVDFVRHLVNHQSCEGSGHDARFQVMAANGHEAYHDVVCGEIGIEAGRSVVMGTAANVNYAAMVSASDLEVEVTAVV